MSDHKLLEDAARKATPGPWAVEPVKGYCDDFIITLHPDHQAKPWGRVVAEVGLAAGQKKAADGGEQYVNDGAYIALANPTAILALLEELSTLQTTYEATGQRLLKLTPSGSEYFNHKGDGYVVDHNACLIVIEANRHRSLEWAHKCKGLEEELSTLKARLGEVSEALKPFAKYYQPFHRTLPDDTVAFGLERLEILVGELRRASESLSTHEAKPGAPAGFKERDLAEADAYILGVEDAAALFESVNPASDDERLHGIPGAGAMGAVLEYRDKIRELLRPITRPQG